MQLKTVMTRDGHLKMIDAEIETDWMDKYLHRNTWLPFKKDGKQWIRWWKGSLTEQQKMKAIQKAQEDIKIHNWRLEQKKNIEELKKKEKMEKMLEESDWEIRLEVNEIKWKDTPVVSIKKKPKRKVIRKKK